ncbi:heat shock 70 kDa protein cognate 4-like isoform X2 [Planococcus citri]|uniref:heat shock 70 kDa protein cognate 4-like isoform X2 n=1 Tax=Planococcus citri TaxID=170843 RepID=UPI0031F96F56
MNSPAIGIHFGSSYSCVGVYQFGKVEIIANDQGSRITPSYVAFTDNGTLIGEAAENQSKSNPKNTIYDVQKMLGCKYNDVHSLASVKHWPFQITEHNEKPQLKVKHLGSYQKYFPEDISSVIIGKMKETAEAYLGKTIRNAVITVPAYFNDSQRAATIDAAKFAGLNLLSIIDEPIAAAIAYGLEQKLSPLKVLVLDMEGGNFNVSVLALENGVFKVISSIHKAYLDIDNYDKRMVNYFAQDFKDTYNKKLTNNKKTSSRLLAACKRARGILISSPVANIDIESFHDGIDYHTRIYRAFFEELNDDFFRRALVVINKAIQDAAIDKTEIEHVVLIGTSSRMPKIQKMLQNFLGEKDFYMSIHPNETVAYGAALQASILNIDESIKEEQNAVLTDCTPLSLGVNAKYDEMAVIVKRRTPIPTRQTAVFDMKGVHQSCFRFGVYEGEYPAVKLNHYLGQVELSGIHHAPTGNTSAYITFEIDAKCTLKVTAVQTWTGSVSQLKVKYDRNRLSCFEVNRMISDAEKYRLKRQQEERNAALSAKNALKSCCSKLVDKVLNFEKDLILNKCEDTILWLNSHQSAGKELYECKQKELENVSDAMDGFINQVKIMLFNNSTSSSQRRPCHPFLTNQITITHDKDLRCSKDKVEGIPEDADKCRIEENKQKDIVFTAKNSLLTYCIEVMSTVKDEKSNIDKFNRDVLLKKCNEAIHWLNQNHSVEKELYESKLEDLKTRFDAVNSTAKTRRKENDKHEALNACFSKRHQKNKPSEMASKCNRDSSEGKSIDFDSDD